jgi:hypothetical protein
MVADEDVLEQSLVVLTLHRTPVLPQPVASLLALLSLLITPDQFADTLIKELLLLAVNHAPHFVPLVLVDQDLLQVQTVLRLVLTTEQLLGFGQFVVKSLVVV